MEMTVSNYCEEANDRKNHWDPQQIEEESAQFSNPVLSNVQPSAELVDEISHKTVEKLVTGFVLLENNFFWIRPG